MADSPSDGEFRVTDRRRRADAEDSPTPAPPPPGPGSAAAAGATAPPPSPAAPHPTPEHGTEDRPRAPGLEGLFMMLASSALMAMGNTPDPVTGQAPRDPAMAADAIDLLVLLRQKTEGNRTAEETQLLDEIIYDLQIRYVAAMKAS